MTTQDRRQYVRVTVDVASNGKLVGRKVEAKWLAIVGLCIAGRDLSDGQVRGRVAAAEADVPERFVSELTKAGVWHSPGHDCPRCPQPDPGFLYIHDYLHHQRSREEAVSSRKSKSHGAALTNHKRWHKPEDPDLGCPFCDQSTDRSSDRTTDQSSDRSTDRSGHRSTSRSTIAESESESEVVVDVVSHSPSVPRDVTTDGLDLDRIKTALRTKDDRRALSVASTILAKAPRPPGNPTAYVVSAIQAAPHLYRETQGPPALGQLCPEHGRDRATCPAAWHQEAT